MKLVYNIVRNNAYPIYEFNTNNIANVVLFVPVTNLLKLKITSLMYLLPLFADSKDDHRVKSIYLYIKEKGTVTTKELVDEFGTTQRTIQRDLNVLEYNELVHSPVRGKWSVTRKKVKVS